MVISNNIGLISRDCDGACLILRRDEDDRTWRAAIIESTGRHKVEISGVTSRASEEFPATMRIQIRRTIRQADAGRADEDVVKSPEMNALRGVDLTPQLRKPPGAVQARAWPVREIGVVVVRQRDGAFERAIQIFRQRLDRLIVEGPVHGATSSASRANACEFGEGLLCSGLSSRTARQLPGGRASI